MEDVGLGNEERKYEEGEVTKDETKKGNKKDKQMKVGVESEKAKEARLETKRSVLSKVEEEGTLEEASDLIFWPFSDHFKYLVRILDKVRIFCPFGRHWLIGIILYGI